ncbi:MAG TPA: hypothetical protein VKB78_01185 [Pirellulales bacterium]|nr:hypothetical protein [Pirellulales bacterium]
MMNCQRKLGINALAISLLACAISSSLVAMEPSGDWIDVTNNVGGPTWGAYGVHYMAAVPGSGAVIAGVSERGLWESANNGAKWTKVGGDEIRNRPDCIVFDPKDSKIFWVSGCYGDSPFRTDDGGRTFHRLGKLQHSDGIAVDFTDPARKTLLLGMHEQSQSTQLSTDGGETWTRIGDRLPADSNHSSDPIVIDAKTFLTNTAGWKPKSSLGIYRSEDGGKTWSKVSDFGPSGPALIASDGTIYWQRLWGGGLIKSTDQGKTWRQISSPIKTNPIELPGKRLAGLAGDSIYISTDGGQTWTKFGPKLPLKQPNGLIYSDKGQAFYAWQMADNMKRPPASIVRLTVK